ncbi:DUF6525 family protein [Roseomonas sp. WA12]
MDNSMAAKPYSKLKGDPYQAYQELPAEVRRALQEALVDWCPLRAREWHLHLLRRQRLRPAQAASVLVETIRKHDHAEVAAFARTWPKGAEAYPHLAAGATLQRYVGADGIPEANPIVLAPAVRPPNAPAAKPAKARAAKSSQARAAKPSKPRSAKPSKAQAKRSAGRRSRR